MIAISENTRADSVRILGLKPERIEVIYRRSRRTVLCGYSLKRAKRNILFVGTIEPRKNLGVLLDAYSSFRLRCGKSIIWW